MSIPVVEVVGYAASVLIVSSLLMTSVLRLRTIGLVGAAVFTIYGVLIGSIPVIVTNATILLVHGHHLRRLWLDRASGYFEVVEWPPRGVYLPRFLDQHGPDIGRFQPEFGGLRDDHTAFVVLRDVVPVGALLVRLDGQVATIDLDYVVPAHRDFRAAAHVYGPHSPFSGHGITRLEARATTAAHRRYLERVGFRPEGGALWVRTVE